jgi:hypothetical protein
MISTFRTLLVVSILIFVGAYWLPYFDAGFFSEGTNDMRAFDGTFALIPTTLGLEIIVFVLGVLIPSAMFFYVWGSRGAFVIFILMSLIANFGFGVRVLTPLDVFLGDLISLLDGVILTMAYFTSVADQFERQRR